MQSHIEPKSIKKLCIILGILSLVGFFPDLTRAMADDFLGAEEVISRIRQGAGSDGPQIADPGKEAAESLMGDLESFKSTRAKLPADEAVDRWLKLYDRFWMLPPTLLMKATEFNPLRSEGKDKLTMGYLVAAMPPPSTWDRLKERVLARPTSDTSPQEAVLRLLVYYLSQDRTNLDKSLSELKASATLSGNRSKYLLLHLRADVQRQAAGKGKETIVEAFDAYLRSLQAERPEGRMTIQVPDLVSLSGEKRTEELILRAIAIPGISLRVPSGGKTLTLAKRLVREHVGDLIEPQWELVTGVEDTELYEVMAKRFPDKSKNGQEPPDVFQTRDMYRYRPDREDTDRRRARINYILGLIAQTRVKEATEQAKRMETEDFESSDFEKTWQSFEKMRYAPELFQFCKDLLTERPEFPLWNRCGIVASSTKESQTLITIVAAAAEKPNLSLDSRLGIRERQVEVLLAMDRVEEAVTLLREMVKVDARQEPPQTQLSVARVKFKLLSRMCRLGKLLGRKELIRESEEIYLAHLREFGQQMKYTFLEAEARDTDSPMDTMIEAFLERGEYAQAEKIVMAAIQSSLKAPELAVLPVERDNAIASGMLSGFFSRLADIYDRAGRYGDVLTLMEKAPWWGATDLVDLADKYKELPPIVAKALHQAGRDPEALSILKGHLYGHPEDDAAYRILTDMTGPSIMSWLDELYTRDRFEERPLIWKAELLRQQGKLEEAEATVRQALKVDPTDGEQKAGDRARAYAVLAKILKAKGKAEDAAFFEGVVSSVRIAEKGDEFTKAGLIQRSLTLYEEAAKAFVDAYCVQWRLAERLSAMGNMGEAGKHYEIAFERMPEQFGQVASFCFGCEGVFTHEQSRGVAEQVLTRLSITSPQKPQVQFLLGQLREAQGRKAEAYRHFRKAVELDPNYLDAWKEAYRLRSDVFLIQAEMDEIALHMLRLDPMNRHASVSPGEITDLRGLWFIYEESGKSNVTVPTHLLTLTSSKENLEMLMKRLGWSENFLVGGQDSYKERRSIPEAGDAVAKNHFVQQLVRFATMTGMGVE
jgi:tetratricopeptide (TPR) repeat protein